MKTLLILIALLFKAALAGSQTVDVVKDLRDQWKVLQGDQLVTYQGDAAQAIHLYLTDQFKGGVIVVQAPGDFAVFMSGKLLAQTRSIYRINVDSLLSGQAGTPLLTIHQNDNVKSVRTKLIQKRKLDYYNTERVPDYFTDFVILSSLLLFGFFIVLFRFNTRLTIDYLNVIKLFSIQEREDASITGRIGSSVNVLFFLFISLLWGLLLLITFHSGPLIVQKVSIQSTWSALGWWLLISLIVLAFLVLKLVVVWAMSALFAYKGVVRFQFFNFIRSMYIASAMVGLSLVGYYILELEKPDLFYFILASAFGFLMLSVFFLYLKLMPRTTSAVFHLFSYLCGSEIISLMILIKVLLN